MLFFSALTHYTHRRRLSVDQLNPPGGVFRPFSRGEKIKLNLEAGVFCLPTCLALGFLSIVMTTVCTHRPTLNAGNNNTRSALKLATFNSRSKSSITSKHTCEKQVELYYFTPGRTSAPITKKDVLIRLPFRRTNCSFVSGVAARRR